MAAFVFENCCLCVELRLGSLIIGYFGLIGSLVLALISILGISGGAIIMNDKEHVELQTAGTVVLAFSCIVLLIALIHVIFDIVLLVGLHKHKRGHVKAYLIFASIFIVLSILSFIGNIASGGTVGDIIKSLFTILISVYFLLVIRSYFLKMNDAAKRPAVYNTA